MLLTWGRAGQSRLDDDPCNASRLAILYSLWPRHLTICDSRLCITRFLAATVTSITFASPTISFLGHRGSNAVHIVPPCRHLAED